MKFVSMMDQEHYIQFQATLYHRSFYEKQSNIFVSCTPQNSPVVDKLSGSDLPDQSRHQTEFTACEFHTWV